MHGIGTQQRGDTLYQCACGLLEICGGAQLLDESGGAIAAQDILVRRLDRASLRQGSFVLRLCEVYWAALLPNELVHGSFDKFDLEEIAWFGWLNWRVGLLPADAYPRWLVVLRTLQLLGPADRRFAGAGGADRLPRSKRAPLGLDLSCRRGFISELCV